MSMAKHYVDKILGTDKAWHIKHDKSKNMRCPECGKKLTKEDAYGHDCEVRTKRK